MTSDPLTRAWRGFSKARGGRLPDAVFKAFQRGWELYQHNLDNVAPSPGQEYEDVAVISGYIAHGAENVEAQIEIRKKFYGTTD